MLHLRNTKIRQPSMKIGGEKEYAKEENAKVECDNLYPPNGIKFGIQCLKKLYPHHEKSLFLDQF